MKRAGLSIATALAALLVLLRIPAAAAAGYDAGLAAYERGDYQAAYDVFAELLREEPADEEVNFSLGLAAFAVGKFSHALFAFERVLMLNPANQRARLELARTYYEMGQHGFAREEFQRVYDANPPESVKRNIEAFLREIQAQSRRWRIEGHIAASAFYDDNVNFGPASKTVDTLLGELQVVSNALPNETWGGGASVGLTATRDIGARGSWEAFGGMGAYRNVLDDASDQELGFARLAVGLRRLERRTIIELPLRGDALDYGHEPLLRILGADPAWMAAPGQDWRFTSRLNAEYRDYQDNDDRDSTFLRFGETIARLWGPRRSSLSLNAGVFVEDADGKAFSNEGWESGLNGEVNLPADITLYAGALYRQMRYGDELYPDLQADPREDDLLQFSAGVRKGFGRNLSLNLDYRFVNNDSNFGLYSYERNIATLVTAYEF